MARTIDEKVVEMRFDNQNFESNVAQSMSTLDKLKSALNFSGVENAFSGISSAADKVNFNGLSGALEGVSEKFSALEAVAVGALMNIGAKVSDLAIKTAKELTIDQVTAGFDKYAKKTEAVQMIMNATGMEIKDVSNQLERLNWYTDETSYDFAEMTASIGKFTAAGIDLETAVTSMQGIANWAGVSGANKAEANRAMYNISQALSTGYMQKIDWKSIENANMATKEFKEMVIQAGLALGTLEEFEGKIGVVEDAIWNAEKGIYEGGTLTFKNDWENGVTFTNMAATLSKGKWLTNEVLTEVLDNYGAFTNELSDVYDELNEEVDITTSDIIKLTNQWIDKTIDWDEACAMTGKTAEELEAILSSLGKEEYALGRKAFAAAQEAKTFRDAIDATKDAVSTGFMNVFEQLFGNYEEAKVLWTDLANELWDIFASPISDLNDMLKAWNNIEMPDGTAIKGRDIFIQSIKDIYHAIRSVVDPITEAWEAIFPSIDFRKLFELTKQFQNFTSTLELSEESMEVVYTTFEGIFKTFALVGDVLKSVLLPFFKQLTGFGKDMDGGLFEIFGQFGEWLNGIIDSVRGSQKFIDFLMRIRLASYNVGKALHDLFRPGDIADIFNENGGGIGGAIAVLIEMLQDANDAFAGVAYAITGDKGVFQAISDLNGKLDITTEKIKTVIDTFENKFGKIRDIFQPLVEAVKTIGSDFFEGLYMIFEDLGGAALNSVDGLNEWLDVVNQMIEETPEIAEFVENVKEVVQEISNFFVHMLSLKDAVQIFRDAGGGLQGFFAVIDDRVTYLIESLFDAIERLTGIDLHFVGDKIVDVIHAIGDGILWLADTIAKAFGWENNPFGGMLENGSGALGSLKEKISEFIGDGDYGTRLVNIFRKIGEGFESLWGVVQKASPTIAKVFGIVGKAVEWLVDQLTKLSLNDVFKLILLGEFAYLLKNLSWVLEGLSEVLEGYGLKLKSEAIRNIALSIVAIAGAAMMIATIPSDKINGVMITLGIAFAGLIGILLSSKLVDKVGGVPVLILTVSVALIAFAGALSKLAGPVEAFGKMELSELGKGFGAIAVALIELGAAITLLGLLKNKAVKGATALKTIATAMTIMWVSLELFTLMDWNTMMESLNKIAIVLITIGGLALIGSGIQSLFDGLSGLAGSSASFGYGVKQIAEALVLLSAALYVVGKIDGYWDSLLKLAAALAALTFVSVALSPFAAALGGFTKAIVNLGKGLLFLSIGLGILGLLGDILGDSIDDIVDSGIDFTIKVLNKLEERMPELIEAISGVIKALIDTVAEQFEGADPTPIITSASALAAGIAAVLALKFFGPKTKDFLKTGWTIIEVLILYAEIIAGFAALGYAINALKDKMGFDVVAQIQQFGDTAEVIADIMFSKVGLLLVAASALTLIYDKLGSGPNASGFGKVVLIIGEAAGVIEAMGLIFGALGVFTDWIQQLNGGGDTYAIDMINLFGDVAEAVADVVGRVAGKLIGGVVEGSIEGFTDGTVYMIEELSKITGDLSNFDDDAITGAKKFGKFILIMSGNDLLVGLETLCTFGLNVLGSLSTRAQFANLGIAITSFVNNVSSLDQDSIARASACVEIIQTLSASVPVTSRSLLDLLIGEGKKDFGAFGDQLGKLGEGLSTFQSKTAELSTDTISNAATCVSILIALSSEMPVTSRSVLDWLIGEGKKDFGDFGFQLAALGRGLNKFQNMTAGLTQETIENAAICVSILTALSSDMPVTSRSVLDWLIGEGKKDFGVFGYRLSDLGSGLNAFQNKTNGLKEDTFNKAATCVSVLTALSSEMPVTSRSVLDWLSGEGKKDFGAFGEQLSDLGYYLVEFQNKTDGLDPDVIANAAICIGFLTEVAKEVPETSGTWLDHLLGNDNSFSSLGSNLVSFADKVNEFYTKLSGISAERLSGLSGTIREMLEMAIELYKYETNYVDNNVSDWLAGGGATQNSVSIGDKIKGVATKLVEKIKDGFSEKITADDGPATKMQEFVDTMLSIVNSSSAYEQFYAAGQSLLTELGNGLTLPTNTSVVTMSFNAVMEEIAAVPMSFGRPDKFKRAGYNLLSYLREGLLYENLVASTRDDFGTFLDSLKELIESDERLQKFMEAGKSILNAIIHGFTNSQNLVFAEAEFNSFISDLSALIISSDNISKFQNAGSALSNAVVSGMTSQDMQQQIKEAGKYIADGFAVGIADTGKVKEATAKMADSVVQTTREVLDINSPSIVMKILGLFTGEGFSSGIWESIPNVQEKVHALAESTIDGVSNSKIVEKMKEIGLLGGGSLAEGLGSKLEGLLNLGDLLPEGMSDDAISNLFNTFMGGEDIQAFFDEGLSINPEKYFGDGNESTSEYIAGLLSEYNDVYDAGLGAESMFNDGLLEKYLEVYGTGDLTTSAYAKSLEDGQEKVEASTEKLGDGAIAGLESYAAGGKNVDKTEEAADAVVETVADAIEDDDGKMRNSGDAEADEWQKGFLENKNWAALSDEIKERIGNAMSGLFGYKLDEEGGLRRVNLSGEYIEVEEVPGSVITWNGTEGTIKSYVQNGVAGYNGSYSNAMATSAQFGMNIDKSEWVSSGNDEDDRIYQEIHKLNENFAEYNENVTNMQIVLDTGTVAGEMTPAINQNLGRESRYSARGM